jgi:hypothetical protein
MLLQRKAQSMAEYAIILGVVIGAIMAVGAVMRGAIEGKVRGMTNIYYNQNGAPTNFQTQVMNSDYVTSSNSQTDVSELANTTKTQTLVGGGTVTDAENLGKTTRAGKTTYFGQ